MRRTYMQNECQNRKYYSHSTASISLTVRVLSFRSNQSTASSAAAAAMSSRSVLARMTRMCPRMERSSSGSGTGLRCFSDGKGKIFSEEEKAKENVYIKKMERERLEKAKMKSEKEKSAAESEKAKSSDEKK